VSALRTLEDGSPAFVTMGDGSYHVIHPKSSARTWRNAMGPADGEVLGSDW
jgi:hypothetical protein